MTSLLDEYEELSLRNQKSKSSMISVLTNQLNFLNMNAELESDERPTLKLHKLKSLPNISGKLQFLAVSEDNIAFITTTNLLCNVSCGSTRKVEELDINKFLGYTCKVKHLFMEPTSGQHILISLTSTPNTNSASASVAPPSDLFYLNTSNSNFKLRQAYKMRGHEVTAVGWNRLNVTSQNTGPILLGTAKGLIFELEINLESEKFFQSSVESYCRQVFDIGKSNFTTVITGLEFYRFVNTSNKYCILVTTVSRLYQFVGQINNLEEKPFLLSIFNNYLNIPETFLEKPSGQTWSRLHIYFSKKIDNSRKLVRCPKFFGWHVDGVNITFAELESEWQEKLTNVIVEKTSFDFTPLNSSLISFALTEFHALLLYADRIIAISILNKETVLTHNCDDVHGKNINIDRNMDGIIFLLSERNLLVVKFLYEDKLIWKMYLDLEKFSLAKQNCEPNSTKYFLILKKEAEYYFNRRKFVKSADVYAQINGMSFEEIALKFLKINEIEALKHYLLKTLEKLTPLESAQITLITFWLMEIFEKQLADARFYNATENGLSELQKNFDLFLSKSNVQNCVKNNKETAYKIMTSHGDNFNLIKLAVLFKDYEKIVLHYLQEDKAFSAIESLKGDPSAFLHKNLIYTFLPDFIAMAPENTIDILKKLNQKIDLLSILPNLIFPTNALTDNEAVEIISYLEYCIHSLHSHDEPVHNYLLALYAKYKPEKILQYLATQGQDPSMVNYEVRYALKLCRGIGLTEACVQLSAMLKLWEDAVDLALTVSKDLAKQTVQLASQSPTNNVELCKKLWLKIAKHVVTEHNDIEETMKFLQQCDLIKIEDVLPFFNDFVTISHFKDAICSSLQEYNQNIEALREEMNDASKSADMIRSDIQTFKHRYTVIQSSDFCCSCNIQLLLRPFYIFPCSHYFHVDCLVRELKPYLNEKDVTRIQVLQSQLYVNSSGLNNGDNSAINSTSVDSKEKIKQDLDRLIASECFFCGSVTIEHIDRPFIEDDEFERIRLEWE